MADGARGGKVGRAERRALRYAAMHSDMDKAAQAGDTGSMNGAPFIPSGMSDTPGAGLQAQWSGTRPDPVDSDFVDGQEASMDEPDDGTGEWESDREREAIKGGTELDTAVVGDPGNLARGANVTTASHQAMSMPGVQNSPGTMQYECLDLKGDGMPDGYQSLTQDRPANFHAGSIRVEIRDLRGASVTQPVEFDRPPNPAAASNASMPSTIHPSLPTGPSHPARGIRWTRQAPGEQR